MKKIIQKLDRGIKRDIKMFKYMNPTSPSATTTAHKCFSSAPGASNPPGEIVALDTGIVCDILRKQTADSLRDPDLQDLAQGTALTMFAVGAPMYLAELMETARVKYLFNYFQASKLDKIQIGKESGPSKLSLPPEPNRIPGFSKFRSSLDILAEFRSGKSVEQVIQDCPLIRAKKSTFAVAGLVTGLVCLSATGKFVVQGSVEAFNAYGQNLESSLDPSVKQAKVYTLDESVNKLYKSKMGTVTLGGTSTVEPFATSAANLLKEAPKPLPSQVSSSEEYFSTLSEVDSQSTNTTRGLYRRINNLIPDPHNEKDDVKKLDTALQELLKKSDAIKTVGSRDSSELTESVEERSPVRRKKKDEYQD